MTSAPPPPPPPPAADDPSKGGPVNPPAGTGSSKPVDETPQPGRSISVGQILAGILLVLVVIFVIENTSKVKVRLIVPEVRAPLAVALLIAAVAGALIGALMRYRRKRHAADKAEAKAARARRKGKK